jgi:hypothetical protein
MEEHEARDLLRKRRLEISFEEVRSYTEIAAALGLLTLSDSTTISASGEGILESNE